LNDRVQKRGGLKYSFLTLTVNRQPAECPLYSYRVIANSK
jgi:hypothetical protein